jgi:hypothetical protein
MCCSTRQIMQGAQYVRVVLYECLCFSSSCWLIGFVAFLCTTGAAETVLCCSWAMFRECGVLSQGTQQHIRQWSQTCHMH